MSDMNSFNRVYEIKRELTNWLYDRVIYGVDEEVGSMDYIDFEDQDMRVFIRKAYGEDDDVCEYDVDIEFGNVPYYSTTIYSSMDIDEITDIVDEML